MAADPPELGAGLPIQQVGRLLGLPPPTLRSWERRYGVPTTPRTPGGHRRYSEEALHQLRLMRDEIARGKRAADAARSVHLLLDRSGQASQWVAEMLAASGRLDPAAVRSVLNRAHDDTGLEATIDDVLLPGMREIGNWWQTGRCDIAQEHLTTEVARGWLSRITADAAAPVSSYPVVIACGPRDLHTLGMEALAALLAHRGHNCRVLGARTPAQSLVTAVHATSAAAAVVVSHLSTQRRAAIDAIRAVAGTGCAVFYAGDAFLFPRARVGVRGTYLGVNLTAAAALVDGSVSQ